MSVRFSPRIFTPHSAHGRYGSTEPRANVGSPRRANLMSTPIEMRVETDGTESGREMAPIHTTMPLSGWTRSQLVRMNLCLQDRYSFNGLRPKQMHRGMVKYREGVIKMRQLLIAPRTEASHADELADIRFTQIVVLSSAA